MRIGILTLPLHTNYGGILQAYALQTVLERMGHEVVVFDTPNKNFLPPFWKLPLSFSKRIVLKFLGKTNKVFIERYNNKVRSVITQHIQPFIDTYIHRKEIRSFKNLKQEDYDAIIVGSDQVWRIIYFPGLWLGQPIENAYLDFAKNWNVKKIAYAASFGTENWEYDEEQTEKCKDLLCKFDAVSTREVDGIKLCKTKFDVDALLVLDPTMLLNMDDYITLLQKAKTSRSDGTLLNYILDDSEEIDILINKVATDNHLVPFSVNNQFEYDDSKPLQQRIKPSVETWLRGFYDAEFVITDSFHACVFSILFKKQFIVVGNKERGMSRFKSLLKMFDLEERLVEANCDISTLQQIDYDKVYNIYDKFKESSMRYLLENIYS